MSKKLEIDGDVADRITVLNLIDYRKYLKDELKAYRKGAYLHQEDVVGNQKRIEALTLIIGDFKTGDKG